MRLNLRSSTKFWERNSTLRGTDKLLCTLGLREKTVTSQEHGPDHGLGENEGTDLEDTKKKKKLTKN